MIDWAQDTNLSWVSAEYAGYQIDKVMPTQIEDITPTAEGEKSERRPRGDLSWYDAVMYCNLLTMMEMGADECVYDITDITYRESHYVVGVSSHINTATVKEVDGWKNKKGYRLPTKDEWQYAAKGGENYKYVGTNEESKVGDYAWWSGNSENKSHQVGIKYPNGYGLYDMTGNINEWSWSIVGTEGVKRQLLGRAYASVLTWCLEINYVEGGSLSSSPSTSGFRVIRKK